MKSYAKASSGRSLTVLFIIAVRVMIPPGYAGEPHMPVIPGSREHPLPTLQINDTMNPVIPTAVHEMGFPTTHPAPLSEVQAVTAPVCTGGSIVIFSRRF